MADSEAPTPGKPVRPTWKQIGLLIFAGVVLTPGLCIALASTSSSMDSAATTMFVLLGLSLLLTGIGGVLAIVRIIKDISRK
jgi:hypothetical protein